MLKDLTRRKSILAWFAVVALTVVVMVAFGVTMTLSTGLMLGALCLVPPGIIVVLWPSAPSPTIAQILRNDAK
jgi:hypothetical protein